MKLLWVTTFRSFNISSENDDVQHNFLKSLEYHKKNIDLCVTTFKEKNVTKNLNYYKIKKYIFNNKHKLIYFSKYSQSICMTNAMQILKKKQYDYLVWSTADIIIPKNLIKVLNKYFNNNAIFTVFPQYQINGKKYEKYPDNFGLDIFIIKNNKESIKVLSSLIKTCKNYGWGCYEHFLSSIHEVLQVKFINLFKHIKIFKYDNDRIAFNDTRKNEIKSWRQNQKFLINYLKINKLSTFYATGSMYYLLYKLFRIQDQNFTSIISHIKILFRLCKRLLT